MFKHFFGVSDKHSTCQDFRNIYTFLTQDPSTTIRKYTIDDSSYFEAPVNVFSKLFYMII